MTSEDTIPVIFIGNLKGGSFHSKLYVTIVSHTNDYLPMTAEEIQTQQIAEQLKKHKWDHLFKDKDFLPSVGPEITTGNIHHLELAKKYTLTLFNMIKTIVTNYEVVILYAIFGTHMYPMSISKEMSFIGAENLIDNLQEGIQLQMNNLRNSSDATILSLLNAMLPFFTVHRGSSKTISGLQNWFP